MACELHACEDSQHCRARAAHLVCVAVWSVESAVEWLVMCAEKSVSLNFLCECPLLSPKQCELRVFGFAHLLQRVLMSLPTSPSLHATLLVPHGRPVYAPLAPRVSLCARARQLLTFCCKWSCLALMTFVFVSSSGCPCQPSPRP